MRCIWKSALASLLTASVVASSLAAPGGVYTAAPPSPGFKGDAPALRDAAHSVAPDGAATYSIPFEVPPGRSGMAPTLTLQYSSRAPLRGGIAAGWTLPIPVISVDTSQGRFANGQTLNYQYNGRRLILVNEPGRARPPISSAGTSGMDTYRADGDTTYTRFEHWPGSTLHEPGHWIARYSNGAVDVFGQAATSKDVRVEGTPGVGPYGGSGRWFLDSSTDARGNIVEYTYETIYGGARNGSVVNTPVDIALRTIYYGRNVNDPTSTHHAQILLTWRAQPTLCPGSLVPIGAQFTYRTGIRRYEGARHLQSVAAYVMAANGVLTRRREMTLHYSTSTESCTAMYAPYRQLDSVSMRAWGPDDDQSAPSFKPPPITFTYGAGDHVYPSTATGGIDPLTVGKNPLHAGKPGGWPTLDSIYDDLEGSGIVKKYDAALCQALPKWPWANGASPELGGDLRAREGCSLAAQVTKRASDRGATNPAHSGQNYAYGFPDNYYGYRFLDVNGDDRPDLLAALTYQKGSYRPKDDPSVSADYPACTAMPAPPCIAANGERIACLFAPRNQFVQPPDNSFGLAYSPYWGATASYADNPGGPGTTTCPIGTCAKNGGCTGTQAECCQPSFCTGSCPAGTCVRGGLCTGSADTCCSAQFCGGEACSTCPPTAGPEGVTFAGNPGDQVFESHGAVPPQHGNGLYGHVPDLHCGYYVYRVYLNQSTGSSGPVFSPQAQVVYSPVPIDGMELSTDFGSGETANASAFRAMVDLDGDERPDALFVRPNERGRNVRLDGIRDFYDVDPEPLQVWLGSKNGTGAFNGAPDGTPLAWPIPPSAEGQREILEATESTGFSSGAGAPGFPGPQWSSFNRQQTERVGLHDINGDGLVDLVRTEPFTNGSRKLYVFYNTGAGFETVGTLLSLDLPGMSRRLRWGGSISSAGPEEVELSMMSHRSADLDGDGLTDIVQVPVPGQGLHVRGINPLADVAGQTTAWFSTGDMFYPVDASARLGGFRKAFAQVTITQRDQYRTVSDFRDVDGDGQADMVMPNNTPSLCDQGDEPAHLDYASCGLDPLVYHAPAQPLRLLTKVENGLGASVEFTYAPMRDESVVSRDAGHQRTAPVWVVKSTSLAVGSNGSATTQYRYQNPIFKFDRQERFGFRGFENVIETGPAAASGSRRRSYTSYRYDLEETGLLSRTLVAEVLADGTEELLTVSDTDYVATPVLGTLVRVFQTQRTVLFKCAEPVVGTTPAAVQVCLSSAGISNSESQWTPLVAQQFSFKPVAYAVTNTTRSPESPSVSPESVTVDEVAHELRYGLVQYQILEIERRTRDGNNVELAFVKTTWDAAGNPVETQVSVDNATNTTAITLRSFDEKGNLVSVIAPNQSGEWMPLEEVTTYDEYDLYPRTVTNELGHESMTFHDLATGAVFETRGPVSAGGRLVERMKLDGIGRVRERRRGVENGAPSPLRVVYDATYVDTGTRTVTTNELFDESSGSPRTRKAIYTLDALGRVIREELDGLEDLTVTTFTYDSAGHLVAVVAPDPSGTGTVTYGTDYDGLGRVIRTRPPLEAPIQTTYQGLTTITEQLATDGAPSLRKEVVADGFDRVVSVIEGTTSPATTEYRYDAADRLIEVIDADGISTYLKYDERGKRTWITRGQTSIGYGYDPNGNLVSIDHPTGTRPFDPQRDVSRWTYDELDRVITSTPARRDWGSQELRRYGPDGVSEVETTQYLYDDPVDDFGIGRLASVETPVLRTTYSYTPEGQVRREKREWSIAPEGLVWSGSSEQSAAYGPTGLPMEVSHPDGQTLSTFSYDSRGRPSRVDVTGGGVTTFAALSRNASGVVTERTTPVSGVTQRWTRDALGRIRDTEVRGTWGCAPSPSCSIGPIAGEVVSFNSVGDIFSSTERGKSLALQYAYDERHQLTSATSAGSAYVAAFQYSGAGRTLQAMVQSNLPGAGVINRNVIHDYTPQSSADTADPGAVRALRDVLTSEELATLTYDASGNLMTRRDVGGSRRFQYDGDDSLRMAVDPDTGATEIHYYDHTGERVLTYQRDASGTSTVRHRFHGTELFYDTGGAATKSTVDVELGDHPVLRVTREPTAKVEHLFHGSLASLLAATDATGQGTARYGYGAFGEVLYAEGPAESTFDRRFNGKADDAISGLRYYGARYYDPLTLSWTQADPMYRYAPEAGLLDPLRMSLYAFSLNNPIRFLDPDGREANTPRGQMLRAAAKVMGIDPGENFGWDRAQDSAEGVIDLAIGFENHYHPKQEWTWHNTVASFSAGLGDTMLFGIFREIRHGLGIGTKTVDESSLTYGGGTFAGVVVMAFLGARAGGSSGGTAAGGGAAVRAGCFVAGTLVQTLWGSQPIEQIQPDDFVIAKDPLTGEIGPRRVLRTFTRYDLPTLDVEIEDADGQGARELIRVTSEHPFWVRDAGWVEASKLWPGAEVSTRAGAWQRVSTLAWTNERETVYNMEVDGLHTYFVGESAVLVHNNPPCANAPRGGTAGGERAGQAFTRKGKAEIDAENAARHGGTNVCDSCGRDVVPGQRSQKGVSPPGNERQRDHIHPKSKGGNGDPSNGRVLCRDCNLEKSDRLP